MSEKKFISYIRVSTVRQGRSGLGLEAQQAAVAAWSNGAEPVAEYVEIESGTRVNRPELKKALAHAKQGDTVLVVAKLDRLARNARFLLGIAESGVEIVFCDLPQMPSGPMGKFFITMMAAVAELESGMISERTKAALTAAKARGTKLGTAGVKRARINEDEATSRAWGLKTLIEKYQSQGLNTNTKLAQALNDYGHETPRGGQWHATSVQRLRRRLAVHDLPDGARVA